MILQTKYKKIMMCGDCRFFFFWEEKNEKGMCFKDIPKRVHEKHFCPLGERKRRGRDRRKRGE